MNYRILARRTAPLAACAAALALARPCLAADTLWGLLRNPDPGKRRPAAAAGSAPVRTGGGDALTGAPVSPAAPGAATPRKRGMAATLDRVGKNLQHVGKILNVDLKVQGQKSFGIHRETVSGSDQAYRNDVYYGRKGVGGIYDQTDLTVTGKVFGLVNFETRYSNNLYGNSNDNRVALNYSGRYFQVDAGDINGSISGNSLIAFNRTLKGVQLSTQYLRGVRFTGLYSQTKAQTRTVLLTGNNGSGPYTVYVGQIVDGTDRVRVNDREMRKGEAPEGDYTLDPYTGELRFSPGTIITEADTIAVSFETYGYNSSAGILSGWRADTDLLKSTKFGVTYLSQKSRGSGSSNREKTDQFYGYENVDSPYTLTYAVDVTLTRDAQGNVIGAVPVRPMTVTVGAEAKVYGVDYQVDPLWPNRVYFRVPVPSTTIVRITYTPADTSYTAGDRSAMGADATINLGKMGNIVAEMASSKLDLSGSGIGDGAWQMRGDMRFLNDKLTWNWALRDIGQKFTAIESTGFSRNDRGLTMGFGYAVSPTLKLTANLEKTRRPSYNYNTTGSATSTYGATEGEDDYSQFNFGGNWQLGKQGQVNFTHNAMKTLLSGGGRSAYGSDTLTFAYRLKNVSMDVSVARNESDSTFLYASTTGSSTTTQERTTRSSALTSRLNVSYRPTDRLSLSGVVARSAIRSTLTSSGNTNAHDMSLTADWQPLQNLKVRLGYQLQDSGIKGTTTDDDGDDDDEDDGGVDVRTSPVIVPLRGGLAVSRQFGGTTGYTYNTGGYSTGGLYGGLGGSGSYSGTLNSGYNASYSTLGGRSRGMQVGLSYQPWPTLSLDVNWNNSLSEGAYLYNSRRSDITVNASYTLGERLALNGSVSMQNVDYIGSTGGTRSRLMYLSLNSKPFGRLTSTMHFQRMLTDSTFSGTDTTTGGVYTGGNPYYTGGTYTGGWAASGSTNLSSYGLRLEYPVWKGNNLFVQHDNSVTSGYWASDQRTTMFGIDFDLGNNMKFTVGWRTQEYISRDTANTTGNYSYKVGALDADLTMRF